jgi:UDP-glucose 4-epimerase
MPQTSDLDPASSAAVRPRVLVTGGRGRVATALWEDLGGSAWDIVRCSREAPQGFVSQQQLLTSHAPLQVDAIVHCAWSSVPATAEKMSAAELAQDLDLLRQWIARAEAEATPPLFVFISTIAVYGETPGAPATEATPPNPKGAYARAKRDAEQILLKSKLPACVLRVAPLYGLCNANSQQGVIAHLIAAAQPGKVFTQWGDDSVKDYLHRTDFTEALRRVVAQRLHSDQPFNLGSNEASHLTSLIDQVSAAMNHTIVVQKIETPAWDVRQNLVDITRLCTALDWQPQIKMAAGIANAVRCSCL